MNEKEEIESFIKYVNRCLAELGYGTDYENGVWSISNTDIGGTLHHKQIDLSELLK